MKNRVHALVLLHKFLERDDISKERRKAVEKFLTLGDIQSAANALKLDYHTIEKHIIHSIFEQKFGMKISEV